MVAAKKKGKFSKGSEVEVSWDIDGYRGAWFRGKVVKFKRRHYTVKFKSLLNKKGTKPLEEATSSKYIRPLPPPHDPNEAFEVSDVVDAYHNDGWWRGIIHKVSVLEENGQSSSSANYAVFFQSPPELANFTAKNLRRSFDWVDGKWVPVPKQMPNLSVEDELRLQLKDGEPNADGLSVCEMNMEDQLSEGVEPCMALIVRPEGELLSNVGDGGYGHEANCSAMDVVELPMTVTGEGESVVGASVSGQMTEEGEIYTGTVVDSAAQEQNTPGVKATGMDFRDQATTVAELTPGVRLPPAGTGDTDLLEEPEWHLVKSPHLLKLWNDVESLEAFQLIPHKPHFKPLVNSAEEWREADAIAAMVTFNHLVLRARDLKVDDDRSSFERCLESLSEVAPFGFDVERVEVRVKKMLEFKAGREELQDEVINVGAWMEETKMEKFKLEESVGRITAEKSKLGEEVEYLTRKLTSLRKKKREFTGKAREERLKMEKRNNEITTLQGKVSSIETRILGLEREFERLAALPF